MKEFALPDVPLPPVRLEPTPRWVRVRAGDAWIADSRRAMLLAWYGPGRLPTYWLPAADVRTDLLRDSGFGPRDGMLAHDIVVAGQTVKRAARLFRDPPPELAALRDHWTFPWDGRVAWYEEATEVHVHARDPYKRVDVLPSERHVRIELAGETLAESRRPHALFETSLPTRWYFPPEDVRFDLLEESEGQTRCPYKGTARYWSARVAGEVHRDLAWTYPEPVPECPLIAGLVAFFNERVDVIVDGRLEERPVTPWSLPPG